MLNSTIYLARIYLSATPAEALPKYKKRKSKQAKIVDHGNYLLRYYIY
jgi:hypothetical protein